MIDTNIINRLNDGRLSLSDLPTDGPLYITHAQQDELARTPDPMRREQLIATLKILSPELVETDIMVVGIAKVGFGRIGNDDRFYRAITAALPNRKKSEANWIDGVIAATAYKNGFVLVTADRPLAKAVRATGGAVRLVD